MTAAKQSKKARSSTKAPALELSLPRGYLSYTQYSLWKRDPRAYRRHYFYGEPTFSNSGMDFGKMVSEALEHGTEDEELKMLLAVLPRYSVAEKELNVVIEGVPVKVFIDTFEPSRLPKFREYKTGRRLKDGSAPWDAVKVRKHEQQPFYSTAIIEEFGKVKHLTHLDWIETKEDEDGVHLTGNIESFERVIEPWEIVRMREEIVRVAREISDAYKSELTSIL